MSVSCSDPAPDPPHRSYRMGFANFAPRFDDFDLVLQTLALWTSRADAAIVNTEVPWDSLYNGVSTVDYVVNHYKGLVEYYRGKNMKLWVYIDPQNGLDRTTDAVALQNLGKSIAQTEVQEVYRRFVIVMDSILNPDHLGLALETNLIRVASSPAIYQGVVQAANDAAAELTSRGRTTPLSVSVQVDVAWGYGGSGYVGVTQDFSDFPFIDELGLSSYPYFEVSSPDELPFNYYSRLVEGKNLPVFVSEGGWSSGSVNTGGISFTSSPALQAEYIRRHISMLEYAGATAWFQLTFTDIDAAQLPPNTPPNIAYFIYLGLVDINLQAKPALAVWDEAFNYPTSW